MQVKRASHQCFLQDESRVVHAFICQKVDLKATVSENLVIGAPLLSVAAPGQLTSVSDYFPHLPGVIGLQLDRGQRNQTCSEAHPFLLNQGDAVEYDGVRQNQSHEAPTHRDQDRQTTVHTEDQGSVLWLNGGHYQSDVMTMSLY